MAAAGLQLERIHKDAAQGLGRLSLMIAKKRILKHDLNEIATRLRRAADDIDKITSLQSGGKQEEPRTARCAWDHQPTPR